MQTIRQYSCINDPTPIRNSDKFIDKQEVEEYNLPVQKFCWNTPSGYKDVYAAFDRELIELIGCSQEKFKRDVDYAVNRRVKPIETELLSKKTELETLKSMNVWATIKWTFNRIWNK